MPYCTVKCNITHDIDSSTQIRFEVLTSIIKFIYFSNILLHPKFNMRFGLNQKIDYT